LESFTHTTLRVCLLTLQACSSLRSLKQERVYIKCAVYQSRIPAPLTRHHSPCHHSPRHHSPRHQSPRHHSPQHHSPQHHSPQHQLHVINGLCITRSSDQVAVVVWSDAHLLCHRKLYSAASDFTSLVHRARPVSLAYWKLGVRSRLMLPDF